MVAGRQGVVRRQVGERQGREGRQEVEAMGGEETAEDGRGAGGGDMVTFNWHECMATKAYI